MGTEPRPHPSACLLGAIDTQLDSNLKARRKRAREHASSLLTGLIEDARGNRLTPSFTIRRGRRYRYYVSQAVVQNPGEEQAGVTRLPAQEIERRVTERLVGFLKSDADVFDQLGGDAQTPAKLLAQVTAAKKLADKLSCLPADDLPGLLTSFLRRVVVGKEQIRVMVGRNDLCQLLRNSGKAIVGKPNEARKPVDPSDLICLSIDARLKRYGGVVHLVVSPNPTALSASKTNPALLKALARAHGWYQSVLEGKATDLRALARDSGFTERYVGEVFPWSFLAPDIVESILQGHQPDDLTFAKLSREIPFSWTEQRRLFGFPPSAFQNPMRPARISAEKSGD